MSDTRARDPWFKFYPSDWRSDRQLRLCSCGARGLWIDCLSLMHEGEPYGHLTINGVAPTLTELSRQLGRPSAEVARYLDELKQRRVCSLSEDGVLVSRRMVRDHAKRLRASLNGQRGGSPLLKGQINHTRGSPLNSEVNQNIGRLVKPELNDGLNGEVKGSRARVPEARSQIDQDLDQNHCASDDARRARFEQFWATYPRKTNRKTAWKVWQRLAPSADRAEALCAAVRRQSGSRQWQDPTHIPHAATWLNQERWHDELPAASPLSPRTTGNEAVMARFLARGRGVPRDDPGGDDHGGGDPV